MNNKNTTNTWKMLFRLMDDVKTYMNRTVEDKKNVDNITQQDVDDAIHYMIDSINTIHNNNMNHDLPPEYYIPTNIPYDPNEIAMYKTPENINLSKKENETSRKETSSWNAKTDD